MSIERRAISALKWAATARIVVQVASWAGTLIVVRLLSPEDYGLMAKVGVVCGIASAIAELGLGTAVVRSVDIARDDLRKIYGVALLFGAVITAALIAASPLIANLFREARLTWPIAVASLQILISATSIVPSSLATQDLSFRNLSKIEMAAGVVNVAVTLLLALAGSGVWALVIGALVGAVTRSAALLATGERVAPLFSLRGIGEPLKFGLTVVSNRVTYFIVVQSDILIGSAFLSTNEIGQYAVALQLATLPLTKVMGIINQIALPAVAQQQTDPLRVRQSVQKASGLISLLAFPALWGISAVAPELVEVLFGGKWSEAVPALVILPLVMPLRMICGILFTASLAMGNRQLDLRNTVINLIVLPLGFFIGAHWGLVGLCLSWLVSVPLAYVFTIPGILQRIGIRPRDFVFESGAPALAAAAMYGSVAALRLMTERWPAIAALFVLSLAGACAYFLVMGLISRRHLAAAASFTRAFLRRDAPTSV